VVRRKIPSSYRDSNPRSYSPHPSPIPLRYSGVVAKLNHATEITMHSETILYVSSSSFLGSTAQLRPWPPPQNPAEFLGGFSTVFFFTG
jgi:hypothetical protein